MTDKKLLFVPDITGFTQFITSTEISHSQHIITELITLIIDENESVLKISEIEGDAILFYQDESVPDIEKMIELAKKMFISFHKQIQIIENNRVCRCGACSTVTNLSLKFIINYGDFQISNISNFIKLFGSDVILVHRLLKNSLNEKEYILTTSDTLNLFRSTIENFIEHKEKVENFGEMNLYYYPLVEIKKSIPVISPPDKSLPGNNNNQFSVFITQDIEKVYLLLIDNDKKLEWVPGLKEVKNSSAINRIGSSHTCIFEGQEINFITVDIQEEDEKLIYIERSLLDENTVVYFEYSLVSKEGGTMLSCTFFGEDNNMLPEEAIKELRSTVEGTLLLFKNYCEKV